MLANLFLLLQSTPSANPLTMLFPFILMFAVMYFLLFLPMQRQRKRQRQMLAELATGTEVLTSGGIIGQIVSIDQDTLVLRVRPDGVKVQIARSAVSSVLGADKK